MNILYVIRGLPGTGKSTLAKRIALAVCEADMFFERDGVYRYDPIQLPHAHNWCKRRCEDYMKANSFTIAVSNTFIYRHHMIPYFDLARKHDYQVTEITMSGPSFGSVHNVPDETIARMKAQWEP